AKAFGAEVTGVSSTAKVDLVRSLGADRVVDYPAGDITDTGERYDVVLDIGCGYGRHSYEVVRRGAHAVALDLSDTELKDVLGTFRAMAGEEVLPPGAHGSAVNASA
ncbi:zinc-binding dehydrogenase, partial [Klebsiella pneumoniae]|uniref:zinc-binding dehydrogenase n=1 Tax=Klebsiella pneumoniae TaxID=573 RepID=UPI003A89C8BE